MKVLDCCDPMRELQRNTGCGPAILRHEPNAMDDRDYWYLYSCDGPAGKTDESPIGYCPWCGRTIIGGDE